MSVTGSRTDILVGIDPRDISVPVLAWAADEAERRNAPLRLVVSVPPLHDTQHVDTGPQHMTLASRGTAALAQAAETVRALHPDLTVATGLLDGMPAPMLCRQAAASGQLVVLGSRRLSRPEEWLSASSVAVPVSAQADCPVVVVREPEHTAPDPGRLVVGVDGSPSSRAAAGFAFAEARLRKASVHALWVWRPPLVALHGEDAAVEKRRTLLATTLAGLPDAYPDVDLVQEVRRGHPVEELGEAARDALAVVVGRRGQGGYSGMRLGSVVHGLLHRAECPVITVPTAGG
ncbi:universal stress protein [Streptomyces zhihengii]|uniref:Universal stress protein n=1 Tax=Streptomyces zhihengii TaxID=1818004 RepID=A0ABS2UJC7_9ACTN|nr:universal stress protein [Streptomyces zhihengii]MBM9617554.1 universal stress protein [Streptomyces zhihengii]